MADVSLKCQCGTVQGVAHNVSARTGTHLVCYCDDCQTFARQLGRGNDVLDKHGGTDIFQLTPDRIKITSGAEQLRCLRLSDKGTTRWFTQCCNTPIGNTISGRLPFVGLIHSFINIQGNREQVLGPIRFHVQGRYAEGEPDVEKLYPAFPTHMMMQLMGKMLYNKLRGRHKPSPFYSESGKPVALPERIGSA